MTLRAIALAASLGMTGLPVLAQSVSIEPGQWEFSNESTINFTVAGQANSMTRPAQTVTECITPEDAVLTPERVAGELADSGCDITENSLNGRTMTVGLVCNQNGMNMTGRIVMTAADDGRSSEGTFTADGSGNGMTMQMTGLLSGRYQGACAG